MSNHVAVQLLLRCDNLRRNHVDVVTVVNGALSNYCSGRSCRRWSLSLSRRWSLSLCVVVVIAVVSLCALSLSSSCCHVRGDCRRRAVMCDVIVVVVVLVVVL